MSRRHGHHTHVHICDIHTLRYTYAQLTCIHIHAHVCMYAQLTCIHTYAYVYTQSLISKSFQMTVGVGTRLRLPILGSARTSLRRVGLVCASLRRFGPAWALRAYLAMRGYRCAYFALCGPLCTYFALCGPHCAHFALCEPLCAYLSLCRPLCLNLVCALGPSLHATCIPKVPKAQACTPEGFRSVPLRSQILNVQAPTVPPKASDPYPQKSMQTLFQFSSAVHYEYMT